MSSRKEKKRHNSTPCVYCGAVATTSDHIPPKCLFPKPRTAMVTVPACLNCNKSYEKDDVLFAIATCIESYIDHPQALKAWESSLRPMILRNPPLKTMLASYILPGKVRTPAGIYLHDRKAIKFPKARMVRIIERIVSGLLWHHYKRTIDADTKMVVYRNPELHPEVAEIINIYTAISWIGDDIFRYRHAIAQDGPDSSIWALQFYTHSQYVVIVEGDSMKAAEAAKAQESKSVSIV